MAQQQDKLTQQAKSIEQQLRELGRRKRRLMRQQAALNDGPVDIMTILEQRERRFREQTGVRVKHQDGHYVRYYKDDQSGERVRVAERLCGPDKNEHEVRLLQAKRMRAVNLAGRAVLRAHLQGEMQGGISIGVFYEGTYLPYINGKLRRSTVRSYTTLWKQYCKPLANKSLTEFRTFDGSQFLTSLASRLNRNSISHVRSLMTAIFRQALNRGYIERNPWREVEVLVRVRKPLPKIAYTPQETMTILNALSRLDAKLFWACTSILAMRPEEVAGLFWEDFSADTVRIQRSAPYGHLEDGETKSDAAKRTLPLIEPVRSLVAAWRKKGKRREGLVFRTRSGRPVNSNTFARYFIRPEALEVVPRFCGLYSGRHGANTELLELTGDIRAGYQVSGHGLHQQARYAHPSVAAGVAGMRKYEAKLAKVSGVRLTKRVRRAG